MVVRPKEKFRTREVNPRSADPDLSVFENTVNPHQIASDIVDYFSIYQKREG